MIPKLQSSINVNFRSKALADLLSDHLQSCPIMGGGGGGGGGGAMDEETADM